MAHLVSTEPHVSKSIAYLHQVYTQASERLRLLSKKSSVRSVAEVALELSVSYATTVLELDMPMFEVDRETEDARKWAAKALLRDTAAVAPFLSAVVDKRVGESEDVGPLFLPMLSELWSTATAVSSIHDMLPVLQAFLAGCSLGTAPKGQPLPVAHALQFSDQFLPAGASAAAVTNCVLGPFLNAGVVPAELNPLQAMLQQQQRQQRGARGGSGPVVPFSATHMFNVEGRRLPPGQLESANATLRSSLAMYRRQLTDLCKYFLRTEAGRDRFFALLRAVFEVNARRAQLAAQLANPMARADTNTDNFMLNVCVVMQQLSSKMVTFDSARLQAKARDLDVRFLVDPSCPFAVDKETRLGLTDDAASKWNADTRAQLQGEPLPDKSRMLTRQLFSTVHALHIGLLPSIARLDAVYRSSRSRLAAMDRERAAVQQRGGDASRLAAELDRLIAERCAFEADLMNEGLFDILAAQGGCVFMCVYVVCVCVCLSVCLSLPPPPSLSLSLSLSLCLSVCLPVSSPTPSLSMYASRLLCSSVNCDVADQVARTLEFYGFVAAWLLEVVS